MHAHEMHDCQMHAHEMHAHEMHACEMHTCEMYAREVHAYEMHAREMYAREVHASEMHANEHPYPFFFFPHALLFSPDTKNPRRGSAARAAAEEQRPFGYAKWPCCSLQHNYS